VSVALTSIDRVSSDIAAHLLKRNLIRESIRINKCYGHKHCQQPYCIKCMSRRVYKQRKHLEEALPAALRNHPGSQLWFLTGAADDSHEVNLHAKAAVRGMREMLKNPRLKSRVIAHFSVLEVALKRGRLKPCAHVHSLVVTKPLDKGRYRISEPDWILMWEQACPLARKRDLSIPLKRRQPTKPRKHASFVAKHAGVTDEHLDRLIRYCTKWATPRRITKNYRALLADPDGFIRRIDSLKGVTRFFGPLHLKA
jgi:Replication protein